MAMHIFTHEGRTTGGAVDQTPSEKGQEHDHHTTTRAKGQSLTFR